MTPEQIAISKYLIEYRNQDGSLLLPQYGGCWHSAEKQYYTDECGDRDFVYRCSVCRKVVSRSNPNLATPDGFFALWDAMQAREDWDEFDKFLWEQYVIWYSKHDTDIKFSAWLINPLTFPETVAAYLKGLER